MKQAARMQQQMEQVQSNLASRTVEATSGGGAARYRVGCALSVPAAARADQHREAQRAESSACRSADAIEPGHRDLRGHDAASAAHAQRPPAVVVQALSLSRHPIRIAT